METTPERLDSRIDSLAELSVIESVEDDSEVQYTLNANSPIVDRLYELSVTVSVFGTERRHLTARTRRNQLRSERRCC